MDEIYQRKRINKIIMSGCYNGVQWVIKTLGSHPVSYIAVSKDTPVENISWPQEITFDSNDDPEEGAAASHIGLDIRNRWIGWDYAHSGDYYMMAEEMKDVEGHKYTYDELIADVEDMTDTYIKATL